MQAALDNARDEAGAAKARMQSALSDAQREVRRAEQAEEKQSLAAGPSCAEPG